MKINTTRTLCLILFLFSISGCVTFTPTPNYQDNTPINNFTSTPSPSEAKTEEMTVTNIVTVEPESGTPDYYLHSLNNLFEEFYGKSIIIPLNADQYLSPNGRYLTLQYADSEGEAIYPVYDIQENQYVDIPIKLDKDDYERVGFFSWSADSSTLLMRIFPILGPHQDRSLLIIQSIDDRGFDENIYSYAVDTDGYYFFMNQDDSRLIHLVGYGNYSEFYIFDITTNITFEYSLPANVFPKDIINFMDSDFLIRYSLEGDEDLNTTEFRIVNGITGESEVVYKSPEEITFIDYDSDRDLLLVMNDSAQFIFLDTITWTETTFLEEDACFGQKTKLIGNCLPYNYQDETGTIRAGLYNLLTGETELLNCTKYLGWYPLFENHLVVVEDNEGGYWVEFLDVVCD